MNEEKIVPELTLSDLRQASEFVWKQNTVRRTPLLKDVQESMFREFKDVCKIHLKLETAQCTGSFKDRGTAFQLHQFDKSIQNNSAEKPKVFTFSSGNYGKAFTNVALKMGLQCQVLMMTVAPKNRIKSMQDLGAEVTLLEPHQVGDTINRLKSKGLRYFSPFDDPDLVRGHSSVAFEIMDDLETPPDILLVSCGGGGLVSSIGAAFSLSGHTQTKVYAVEPETANVMHRCFRAGHRVDLPEVKSIASGLCSPFGGVYTYPYCRKYVTNVLLVSDAEIIDAVQRMYKCGLVVEPSGAAGLAALLNNKLPIDKLQGKSVAVLVCGGNVTPEELKVLFDQVASSKNL